MKIVTWNINGLRATVKNLKKLIDDTDADIICIQETKISRELLTSDVALIANYNSYFSFSQKRAGYSGVATFCKNTSVPVKAQAGLSNLYETDSGSGVIGCYGNLSTIFDSQRLKELDCEGRAIITQHEIKTSCDQVHQLIIINVYCPRAEMDDEERYTFKIDFYKALEERAKAFLRLGYFVIVLGDINTSHKLIDHCDPCDPLSFHENKSRLWLNGFIYDGDGNSVQAENRCLEDSDIGNCLFIDSFRYFYPNKPNMFTCWCTSNRARETNYGTRIDYVFCDKLLAGYLKSCEVLSEFQGSDHCPVETNFNIEAMPSKTLPPLCTSLYIDFGGKQQKLSNYFSNKSKMNESNGKRNHQSDESDKTQSCKRKVAKVSQMKLTSLFAKVSSSSDDSQEKLSISKLPNKVKGQKSIGSSKKDNPSNEASMFWKKVLKGPDPPPLCTGHNEACVKRTVKKEGANLGRQFYCCARPEGHRSNPDARCQFFKWC